MKNDSMKISVFEKSAYGFGDMASCLFWQTFTMFLLFFYTDVFGISAAAAGTMFLIVRILDICFDPFIGMFADRTKSRFGRFRPWILYGMVPFGVLGFLMFLTPDWATSAKLVYAYITYTAMMIVYSIVNIPYGALVGVITSDTADRTSLAAYRAVFAFLGGGIVQLATPFLVRYFGLLQSVNGDTVNEQFGWATTMGIYAILAILLFSVTVFGTKERVEPIQEEANTFKSDVKDLLNNRPWILLTLVGILTCLFTTLRNGTIMYYFKYYVDMGNAFNFFGFDLHPDKPIEFKVLFWSVNLPVKEFILSAFMFAGSVFSIVGTMMLRPIAMRLGKKNTYIASMALGTLCSLAYYFLSPNQITEMFVFQIIANFAVGPAMAMMWSMYADTADYSEYKTGRRATGLIFSSASSGQKLGWAFGGWITGIMLAAYGFVANAEASAETQNGIVSLFSFIPIIASLLAIIVLLFYKLDEKTVQHIIEELTRRKAEKAVTNE